MNTYPPNWDEIALACKVAVGWRCVRCKHPDDPVDCERLVVKRGQLPCDEYCTDHPRDKQRILTVHHLDGDKANCNWWNLAPLCQACHLTIQTRIKMAQLILFPELHSDWMLPYLVGGSRAKLWGVQSYEQIIRELKASGNNNLWPHPFTTKR